MEQDKKDIKKWFEELLLKFGINKAKHKSTILKELIGHFFIEFLQRHSMII